MFATTVIHPASAITERYRTLILVRTLTPMVEVYYAAFLWARSVGAGGLLLFNRFEQAFMGTT